MNLSSKNLLIEKQGLWETLIMLLITRSCQNISFKIKKWGFLCRDRKSYCSTILSNLIYWLIYTRRNIRKKLRLRSTNKLNKFIQNTGRRTTTIQFMVNSMIDKNNRSSRSTGLRKNNYMEKMLRRNCLLLTFIESHLSPIIQNLCLKLLNGWIKKTITLKNDSRLNTWYLMSTRKET